MEQTIELSSLKKRNPQIFFCRWNIGKRTKPIKIVLFNILTPKIKVIDKTTYYVFEGMFEETNYMGVLPKIVCDFWIAKLSFENSIIEVVDFCNLANTEKISVCCGLKRETKKSVRFYDVKVS